MKNEKYTEGNIALINGVQTVLVPYDILVDYNTRALSVEGKGHIEPIELTKDNFKNWGFELDSKKEYYEREGIKVWIDNNGGLEHFYHLNSELFTYFHYVHRFQNWYFETTDEELIINPE